MNGFSFLFWGVVDWVFALAHDPGQRWRLECPYCETTHYSRSPTMVLVKNSLHHEFGIGDGDHPGRDEMTEEEWADNPRVEPELVAGTTHREYEDTDRIETR